MPPSGMQGGLVTGLLSRPHRQGRAARSPLRPLILAGVLLAACRGYGAVAGTSDAPSRTRDKGRKPAIVVTNFADGETIRYPVPLLVGTLADEAATSLVVENRSSRRDTRRMHEGQVPREGSYRTWKGLAHKGRSKALAELVREGENTFLAEVSRGGGDWSLYLRLEDEDGSSLRLDEKGRLISVAE